MDEELVRLEAELEKVKGCGLKYLLNTVSLQKRKSCSLYRRI